MNRCNASRTFSSNGNIKPCSVWCLESTLMSEVIWDEEIWIEFGWSERSFNKLLAVWFRAFLLRALSEVVALLEYEYVDEMNWSSFRSRRNIIAILVFQIENIELRWTKHESLQWYMLYRIHVWVWQLWRHRAFVLEPENEKYG